MYTGVSGIMFRLVARGNVPFRIPCSRSAADSFLTCRCLASTFRLLAKRVVKYQDARIFDASCCVCGPKQCHTNFSFTHCAGPANDEVSTPNSQLLQPKSGHVRPIDILEAMPAPLRKLYSRAYVRLRKGTQDGWFVVIGKANRVLPASRSEGYKVILAKADQVVFNDTLFFGLDAGQIDSMSQALATLCERMLLKISEYSKFTKTFPATNALRAGSMTPWTWHLPPMSFRLQAGDLSVDSRVSMLDTAATEQGRFQRIAAFTSEMSIQVNRLGSIHAVPVVLERFAVPEFPQLLPKDKCGASSVRRCSRTSSTPSWPQSRNWICWSSVGRRWTSGETQQSRLGHQPQHRS